VDDFVLARGATEPITSKQNAAHVWEPKFLVEIMAGRDPHVAPSVPKPAVGLTVAGFLDLYFTNYVEAEGLRDPVTVRGSLKAIKKVLGDLPVGALEKAGDILRFKAVFRKGREIATVDRGVGYPPRGDQLGSLPGSAIPDHDAISSIRRQHQSEGGNETRSASRAAGRAGLACGVLGDERRRSSVRRRTDARPSHRRA